MGKNCTFCGKPFVAKRSTAKFCSGACKLKANRMVVNGGILVTPKPNQTPGEVAADILNSPTGEDIEYTPTDLLFEEYRPGYYKFGDEVYARSCLSCDKDFTTRLELTKFCSPDCKKLLLSRFSGKK